VECQLIHRVDLAKYQRATFKKPSSKRRKKSGNRRDCGTAKNIGITGFPQTARLGFKTLKIKVADEKEIHKLQLLGLAK